MEKVKIDGLGDEEFEVSEEGLQAIGAKALASMKDSHDQATRAGDAKATAEAKLAEKEAKIAELEASLIPPPAQDKAFNMADDELVYGKHVKTAIADAIAVIKKELQPTLQSMNSSVIESQVAQIRAKRPDITNEELQKVIAIQQTFTGGVMKDYLIQMGHNIQSATKEDMALWLYDGAQKGFVSGDGGTTGIYKQGIRESKPTTTPENTENAEFEKLGYKPNEIVQLKSSIIPKSGMTVKEWLEQTKKDRAINA